jgi:hypothetical protein
MDKVYDEIKSKDIGDVFDIIVNVYGITIDEVMQYDKLVTLIGNKLLDRKRQTGFLGFNPRPYIRYMSRIGTKLSDDVVNSDLPPQQKIFELYDILWFFNDTFGEEDTIDEILTLIPKVLDFYFKTYPPKKAIQIASILKDKIRGRRFYSTITNITNDFAEQNNLKVFPKTAGLTFQKKDGMLQDLIDYITDREKKTKEGFLKYINSRGRTPGQHSTFFRAAVASGVVKKVRDGRTITYELGPNYEAWKNGNLVAI